MQTAMNKLWNVVSASLVWLLLLGPLLYHRVDLKDAFGASPELAVLTLAWLAIVGLGVQRAWAGLPVFGGGEGSWARRAVMALLAWMGLSAAFGVNPGSSSAYMIGVATVLMLGQSLLGWMEADLRRRWVLGGALGMVLGWQALIALLQRVGLPTMEWAQALPAGWAHDYGMLLAAGVTQGNILGTLGNVNYLAEVVLLLTPLMMAGALRAGPRPVKIACGLLALAGMTMMIAAGSRGVLLALVVAGPLAAMAVYGVRAFDPRRHWANPRSRVVLVVAVLAVALAAGGLGGRLATKLGKIGHDESINTRVVMWQSAVHLWQAHSLTGVGVGGYKLVNMAQLQQDQPNGVPAALAENRFAQAHNEPLQLLVETGAIGFLLAGAALAWWFRETRRNPTLGPHVRFGLLWSVGGLAIASMFAFPLHIPLTGLLFVAVLALGLTRQREVAFIPAAWRPGYAIASFVVLGTAGVLVFQHGVTPLFRAQHYAHLAYKVTELEDVKDASILWTLADRAERYHGYTRWQRLRMLVSEQRYAEAIALYEQSPNVGLAQDSRYWYGRALAGSGRKQEAEAIYRELLAFYPPGNASHERIQRYLGQLTSRGAGQE